MPPPSPLAIATSSVRRLLKEDASYHKELAGQEAKIKTLKEAIQSGQADEDGNGEWTLKQEQVAAEETRAVFGPLRKRIEDAVMKLEEQIAAGDDSGASAEELSAAKEVLAQSKASSNGSS